MSASSREQPGRRLVLPLLVWLLFAAGAAVVFLVLGPRGRGPAEVARPAPRLPGAGPAAGIRVLAAESPLADTLDAIKEVFESDEGVQVELVTVSALEFRTTAFEMLRAGACDALILDVEDVSDYADQSLLRPLDEPLADPDLVSEDYDIADLASPAVESCGQLDGQTYALPVTADVQVLYYRKDRLGDILCYQPFRGKYGYGLPCPPRTWDEARDVAEFFREQPRPRYGMVIGSDAAEDAAYTFTMLLRSYGGRVLDSSGVVAFDDDAGARALSMLRDLVATGPPGLPSLGRDEVIERFKTGEAAMCVSWWRYADSVEDRPDGYPSAVRDLVGYAVLPSGPPGEPSPLMRTSCVAVPANAPRPRAALKFAIWLTDPVTSIRLSRRDIPPVRKATLTNEDEAKDHPQYDVLLESLQLARPMPRTTQAEPLREALGREICRGVVMRGAAAAAVRRAADAVRAAME